MSVEKKIRFEVKLAILVYPKLAKPSFLRRMKFQNLIPTTVTAFTSRH
jgi:hypothetical protein